MLTDELYTSCSSGALALMGLPASIWGVHDRLKLTHSKQVASFPWLNVVVDRVQDSSLRQERLCLMNGKLMQCNALLNAPTSTRHAKSNRVWLPEHVVQGYTCSK